MVSWNWNRFWLLFGWFGWLVGCIVEVMRNEDMFLFSSCLFVCLFVDSFFPSL